MDRGMCNGCRSLSRISTVFAVIVVSLVLPPVSSIKLPEQTCQPRPVVVHETEGYKPYHILMHRCSGTCNEDMPPKQNPCTALTKEAVKVEVTDPLSGDPKTITVYNHTSCRCDCNMECNWGGERLDDKECRCVSITDPDTGERGGKKETVDVLPYKIGLASMGFVTVVVLVFELIMCAKRREVLERVKESCCKKEDRTDGREQEAAV